MKNKNIIILIITFFLILCLSISGILGFLFFKTNQENFNWFNDCITTYNVTSDSVVYKNGGQVMDLPSQLGIITSPLEKPYNKTLQKGPLLFIKAFNEDKIYLNFAYFENVEIINVTASKMEKSKIGTYKELDFEEISPREITRFLIKSGIIQTYQHLGATVCLYNEVDSDDTYKASYRAEHELCTNECHSVKFNFEVYLDKETGDIYVLK